MSHAVYHERQSRKRCGLHAVNALLQRRAYTASEFDALADSLMLERRNSWFHPHRSMFGLGDYDANVLLCALQKYGLDATWLTAKDDYLEIMCEDSLRGFLINVPSSSVVTKFLKVFEPSRHWFAVSKYGTTFYVVDSSMQQPMMLKSKDEVAGFLTKMKKDDAFIMRINAETS